MGKSRKSKIYLVDGSGYLFRAYHAISHLSNSRGIPTNAVFGVTRMLVKLLDDVQPSHIVVIMDPPGKNFRHELYPEYKANRPPAPEDLKIQIPLVHRAIESLALPLLCVEGYEADDVIATLCRLSLEAEYEVVVVSSDKDLMQLVGEGVIMFDPMRNKRYDPDGVREKLGVDPGQVNDLLGLMGDSSDNIPGIKGVGAKTAAKLLGEYGDMDSILEAAPDMKKSKLKERLIEQADQARLSRELAALCEQVPIQVEPAGFVRAEPDPEVLDAFLAEMEFGDLRKELTGGKKIDTSHYTTVRTMAELDEVLEGIRSAGVCALDLETTSLDPMRAEIIGISLCSAEGQAAYVPVAHSGPDAGEQLDLTQVVERLRPLLGDPALRIFGQNIKYDALIMVQRHDLHLAQIACDSMLASYVLDPGRVSHGLDALSRDLLGHQTISYEEVAGKGKAQVPFEQVPVEQATAYAGEDADVTYRLCEKLLPQVEEAGLGELMFELELPLIQVLLEMQRSGVLVDAQVLERIGDDCQRRMEESQEKVHQLAGHAFNLNSPTQLRVVLFEELGLPVTKKTKSGPSTDQTVLEELVVEHELPGEILAYRSMAKLKSTYLDVLPTMIHPETGRIHTSYNQAVAATGRLSSSDPNLQNIPIRTELGKRVREAFVAPPGHVLLSADYSQVELRILAHLSGDEALLEAFSEGEDVHARTAARIFDVSVDKVSSQMRSRAKAVNFGIVYGQGPYNLARQLQISRTEAKEIIDSYLQRHHRVGEWVSEIHAQARRDRLVTTLFGRRRFLPDIEAKNHNVRSNAERMAQNTPIQGTAADIIKRAMIQIHRALGEKGLSARMLLQVHDELVFEVPEQELSLLESLVRKMMEGAADLAVPLTVDISSGRSWAEAH